MHEAFWNGLLDVRWEDAPLGPETTRLVLRLRECGYAERTCRDYGHAVIHLGRVLREETGGSKGFAMTRSSRTSSAVIFRCAAATGARRAGGKSGSGEAWRTYLRDFLASRGDAVSRAELMALTAEDLLVFSRPRGVRLGRTAWNTWPRRCPASTAGWACRVTRQGIWSDLLSISGRRTPGPGAGQER